VIRLSSSTLFWVASLELIETLFHDQNP
jgi:hypothetical protein